MRLMKKLVKDSEQSSNQSAKILRAYGINKLTTVFCALIKN